MGPRQQLHNELINFAEYVYYQPPSTIKMKYPCIVYHLSNIKSIHADDMAYYNFDSYLITYICETPDDSIVHSILEYFKYCRFDQHYVADNLHHYTFYLFY